MLNSEAFNIDSVNRYKHNRGCFLSLAHIETTITLARLAANEAFYGQKGISVPEILTGKVPLKGPPGCWYVIKIVG